MVAKDGGRSIRGRPLPGDAGLDAATLLGAHAGNAVAWVVQVVERRRAKGRARQRPQLQAIEHREGIAQPAGAVGAVVGVVVATHIGLHAMGRELPRVGGDEGVVAALAFAGEDIGAGTLGDMFVGDHELLVGGEGERVLPGALLAAGDEAARHHGAARQVVDTARGLQRRCPDARYGAAVVGRDDPRRQPVAEVRRGVGHEVGRWEVGAVVVRLQPRLDCMHGDAVTGRRRVAELQRGGVAGVAVAVGIEALEAVARKERGDATAAVAAQRSSEIEGAGRAADSDAALARAVAAESRSRDKARIAVAATGEDLDDATDSVSAVEARCRPAQHLDAFDLRQAQCFQLSLAERRRADAHAVDHHDRAVGAGTADEEAGALARAAIARQLHAGLAADQVFHGVGSACADRRGVDDDDVGGGPRQRLRLAAADDDDRIERRPGAAGGGRGDSRTGEEGKKGQGATNARRQWRRRETKHGEETSTSGTRPASPRAHANEKSRSSARVLAGIRADGPTPTTFPKTEALSGMCVEADGAPRSASSSAVPLRGQRSLGIAKCEPSASRLTAKA